MKYILPILLTLLINLVAGRKHHLTVKDDTRKYIAMSTFGFLKGGYLEIRMTNLTFTSDELPLMGLRIEKTVTDGINPVTESVHESCILLHQELLQNKDDSIASMFLVFDFKNEKVKVQCSPEFQDIEVYNNFSSAMSMDSRSKRNSLGDHLKDSSLFTKASERSKRSLVIMKKFRDSNLFKPHKTARKLLAIEERAVIDNCVNFDIPLKKNEWGYFTSIFILIDKSNEEGLYSLFFDNCDNYNYNKPSLKTSFTAWIVEKNENNYLSAGDIPLPGLYFLMSGLFFIAGFCWIALLKKSNSNEIFKIHWIMTVLVFTKSLSLLFHGINFHFIRVEGSHIEAWAVLYYITHLLKGALLFITIVLIGSGWTFVKHILSDKDKRVFTVVIPLQILANIAVIVIEESEEGAVQHNMWQEIFILVDLLCCGAILLPIVWSIKHLQEASETDGKAASNLRKLRLFRHFYIMIVCYIYFTRIIVYLLKITLPFKYSWLDELFREVATLGFFITTGSKFRPASNNPYLQVPSDDEEVELEQVLTTSGATQEVKSRTIHFEKNLDSEPLINKRESSHEYD